MILSSLIQARRLRKTLGGGMRQVGILCAAALVALRENVGKLESDHKKAKILAGTRRLTLYIVTCSIIVIYLLLNPVCASDVCDVFRGTKQD